MAPSTNWPRSPFCRAKRMENEVIFTPGGVSPATLRKACESVTTRAGGRAEPVQGVAQLPLLDDQAIGVAVQQVADGLHLRDDQAALGGLQVDRHDQHGQLARRHQVGHDGRRAEELLRGRLERGPRGVRARRRPGSPPSRPRGIRAAEPSTTSAAGPAQVRLVEDGDGRGPVAAGVRWRMASSKGPQRPAFGHHQPQVGAIEDLPGLLHAKFAEGPDVVDARRVDEEHRPQRQQFHRLFDRIGRSAGQFARRWPPAGRHRALRIDDLPALRRPNRPMWRRRPLGAGCISLCRFRS